MTESEMTIRNKEFNEIYDIISNASAMVDEFYIKYIFANEKCDDKDEISNVGALLDKIRSLKALAHSIAEHYTWDWD
jgi:hypothetical protein